MVFSGYITSFIILVLMNPGIPGKDHYKLEYFKKYRGDYKLLHICKKCNILLLKNLKSSHCALCNICIMKYDHHCPWIGKCIGKYNFILFYFFLLFASLFFLNGMVLFALYLKNNHFFNF